MKRFKTWKRWVTPVVTKTKTGPFDFWDTKSDLANAPVVVLHESDYRKIMAVYRAASIVSSFVIISPFMNERQCDAIEALDIAIERAEK